MADDVDKAIEEWYGKLQKRFENVGTAVDKGLLKSALYGEQKAKQYTQERIYTQPIPTWKNGHPKWKRTGAYKASIQGIMNPNMEHSSALTSKVKYAKVIEYGDSKGHQGKYILTDAIMKNKDDIRKIIKNEISKAIKNG